MTSAPICAIVMPPSGAATNAENLDDPQILKHPVHRPILSTRGRRGKTVAVGALIGVPAGVSLGMPDRGAERALIPPAGVGAAEVSPRRR